ncbi:MAG TPA: hypothetical protein PLT00_04085 [Verrucomicrobiota bacterium]|jgi:hypothetical protein|nr:hypothetical protein [Verrucomicrobiota bacterium]HQB15874.1 hypothetical protein [Verrucomicrobiota bacterium]
MSQQYNKVQKRRRRQLYLKRKRQAAKAARPVKAPATPAAAPSA